MAKRITGVGAGRDKKKGSRKTKKRLAIKRTMLAAKAARKKRK